MTKEYTETLTEVSEILNNMNENDINKIPKSIINYINKNKSNEYNFKIIPGIPFEEQKIKRETLALLAMFSLYYWCENPEEKNNLYKKFVENERIEEEEKRRKYNPDDLFKVTKIEKNNENQELNQDNKLNNIEQEIDDDSNETEPIELIEYKEPNFLMKIILKLRKLFGKDKN